MLYSIFIETFSPNKHKNIAVVFDLMARTTFNLEIEYINVGLTNDSLSPLLSSRVEISFTYKNVFQNVSVNYGCTLSNKMLQYQNDKIIKGIYLIH